MTMTKKGNVKKFIGLVHRTINTNHVHQWRFRHEAGLAICGFTLPKRLCLGNLVSLWTFSTNRCCGAKRSNLRGESPNCEHEVGSGAHLRPLCAPAGMLRYVQGFLTFEPLRSVGHNTAVYILQKICIAFFLFCSPKQQWWVKFHKTLHCTKVLLITESVSLHEHQVMVAFRLALLVNLFLSCGNVFIHILRSRLESQQTHFCFQGQQTHHRQQPPQRKTTSSCVSRIIPFLDIDNKIVCSTTKDEQSGLFFIAAEKLPTPYGSHRQTQLFCALNFSTFRCCWFWPQKSCSKTTKFLNRKHTRRFVVCLHPVELPCV